MSATKDKLKKKLFTTDFYKIVSVHEYLAEQFCEINSTDYGGLMTTYQVRTHIKALLKQLANQQKEIEELKIVLKSLTKDA